MADLAQADLTATCDNVLMALLDSLVSPFASARDQLLERVSGLEDDEYLWEPFGGMWSVRMTTGGWRVDWADPDPEPAPLTTIAWRMWHIAVDALDSYSSRAFSTSGTGCTGTEWVGSADKAVALTESAFNTFLAGYEELGERGLNHRLGDAWNDYAESTHLDLFLHALREVTHHAAEVALLRDIYRAGSHVAPPRPA